MKQNKLSTNCARIKQKVQVTKLYQTALKGHSRRIKHLQIELYGKSSNNQWTVEEFGKHILGKSCMRKKRGDHMKDAKIKEESVQNVTHTEIVKVFRCQ